MSVDEVAAALRQALAKLSTAALEQAAGLLDEAHQALTQVGSQQPELQNAAASLNRASQDVGTTGQLVSRACAAVTAYLDKLGAGEPPPEYSSSAASSSATIAARPSRPVKPDGLRLTRDQAAELQQALPPPVTSMSGQKTHGRWVDENGQAHEIVSGRDDDAAEAARILREKGIPQRGEVTTSADVEQKLAARMVREGRMHLDVVLNNQPCRGVFGCDALLPVILPEGYSLTVHAPNYKKTFTGGKKSWSR